MSVGKPIPHESADGHVTGEALYTDDLASRFVGALTAWPVQAPHAKAQIRSIDASAALAMDGVVTVLSADDVPGKNNVGPSRPDEPLFPQAVTFYGQAVLWVLADDEESAKRGAQAVLIDYEPQEPILTVQAAIDADSMLTETARILRGAPEQAIANAPNQLSGEFEIGGQEHFYLETNASLAYIDEAGQIMVHASTQHPTETQLIVARVLGLGNHDVICQSLRMGGAFGGKEVQANAFAAVAAVGALKTGRPVRVRLDRRRDIEMTGKRHPFLARYSVGYADDGEILGARIQLFSDGGYSLDLSKPVMQRALFHVDNCYRLANIDVTGTVARTNKCSQTAFRGFGGPQGMLVIEEIIDHVARSTNLPPHTVRQCNFYREGDTTHYEQEVTQAERISRIFEELKRDADFDQRWQDMIAFNSDHPHRKRGLAITPVKFGISFTTAFFNQAGALVLLYQDGSLQVNHGGTEMGQGLHTKMLQVAAQAMGVDLDAVRMMPTRTDKVPNTSATAASSGSDLNGQAVRNACMAIREKLVEVAAGVFATTTDKICFDRGRVFVDGKPEEFKTFAQIAKQAYLQRVPLMATGYYRTPNIHYDDAAGRGHPFHYYAYGAAIVEVELDAFTGQYEFRRVDILHDVGDSMSPLVDIGQVEGGFIQGLGWLTREELVWTAEGRIATNGASTYKLPSLDECPREFNVRFLERATEPGVIHGSKAVGEPPFMLAIAAREAIRQAVAAFREEPGPVHLGCPSTPEAVYWAIQATLRDPAA